MLDKLFEAGDALDYFIRKYLPGFVAYPILFVEFLVMLAIALAIIAIACLASGTILIAFPPDQRESRLEAIWRGFRG